METKQVFKNTVLTKRKTVKNILGIFDQTTEDMRHDWYLEAYIWAIECLHIAEMNAANTLNINKACGVIAALSPVKSWGDNKKIALDMMLTEDCGHMMLFKGKAYLILHSNGTEEEILSILNGQKIKSFYLNIRYPHKHEEVTIDRHALRVALMRNVGDNDYRGMTALQYKFFVDSYKYAAKKRNVSPVIVQSATWLYIRENKHILND